MNQQPLISYFLKAKPAQKNITPPPTYEEMIKKLKEEAEKAFDIQQRKVVVKKQQKVDDQSPLSLPKMSYKKYTMEQKASIVNLAPHMTYVEIEKKYGVDESTVRYWVKCGIKPDQRKENGKTPKYKEIEDLLIKDLLARREEGLAVTSAVIFKRMKELMMEHFKIKASDYNLLQNYARYCSVKGVEHDAILNSLSDQEFLSFDNEEKEIKLNSQEKQELRDAYIKSSKNLVIINNSWLSRFTRTHNLVYRKITHLSSKIQAELEKDAVSFVTEIHKFRREEDVPPELIINFDETAIFYDMMPTYTYDRKGTSHPSLKVSKLQKKRLTAGLGITAAGDKLNSVLIFKGKGERVNKLINARNYMIRKNNNAWMTSKIFLEYLNQVVKPYVMEKKQKPEFINKKALVIVDNFIGHKLEESEHEKFKKIGIFIKYLKPYTTHMCQPLDLNINFLLKSKMKSHWIDWIEKEPEPNPTKMMIYNWFSKSWALITPLNIIKAFLMSGISNNLDGSEDNFCQSLEKIRVTTLERKNLCSKEEESAKDYFEDAYASGEHQFSTASPEEELHTYELMKGEGQE